MEVNGQKNVIVTLSQDVSELEEVVVIGYGTVLKKDLTGSVASVEVSDEIARQSSTVDQLLQGEGSRNLCYPKCCQPWLWNKC